MERIIEVCCGGYYDALQAYKGGAKRIELNSALHLGGLTPTIGSLVLTKKSTDLKVICMDRPRSAGFHYDETDFETMKADAHALMQNGADGIAFGCLDEDGNIDVSPYVYNPSTHMISAYSGEDLILIEVNEEMTFIVSYTIIH